jgi:hypothetical protein
MKNGSVNAIKSPWFRVKGERYTIVCTAGDVHTLVRDLDGERFNVDHDALIERINANLDTYELLDISGAAVQGAGGHDSMAVKARKGRA